MKKYLFPLLFILLMKPISLNACTAFCLYDDEQILVAKNLDWPIGDGLVLINKSGVEKSAFTDREKKLRWTSQYGSVTFNQFGKEFPLGGMNEAGLVIEELNLFGKGPQHDSLFALNEFQWVQYHLDNYATVDEIIESGPFVAVVPILLNLHYFITDSRGAVAIIEFYDSQVYIYKNNDVPYPVLSNNTYENSLKYLRNFRGFGGDLPIRRETTSGERFVRTAASLKEFEVSGKTPRVKTAFAILDSVRQDDTRWSIVYDIRNKQIHFHTAQNTGTRIVDIEAFDFTCETQSRYFNILSPDTGYISTLFRPLAPQRNTDLVMEVCSQYRAIDPGNVTGERFLGMAEYGNGIGCGPVRSYKKLNHE